MGNRLPKVAVVLALVDAANRKKLAGIFDYIRSHVRWDVHLLEPEAMDDFDFREMDGVLIGDARFPKRAPDVPTVIIHIPQTYDQGFSYVMCDNRAVASTAAGHLVGSGFKSFAYVHDRQSSPWSVERANDFRRELVRECRKAGNAPDLFLWSPSCGQDMTDWLKALPQRTAIFAADDSTARDVMLKCASAGIVVPRDLSLLGVDNDELLCESCPTALSSVEPDFRTGGCLAARALDNLMRGKRQPKTTKYGVKGIALRESCRYMSRRRNPRLDMGLRFIRENATAEIGVADVAKSMGVARRTAELIFRKSMKTSIGKSLRLARLDGMMRLLKESNLSTAEICARSGFQSESHAKRAFRERFGKPMSSFH